jgi:hypothetical protein
MITQIQNKFVQRPVALILTFAILNMSFTMPSKRSVVLQAGTNVPLETATVITSDLAVVGQIIDFKVSRDVMADGEVVIPYGSIAKGQVVRAQAAKGLGKEGFIEVQIRSVQAADGQEVFLSGNNLNQSGENRQTLAIVLGVLVCLLFLAMKGKEVVVPAGYKVDSYVASNVTFDL